MIIQLTANTRKALDDRHAVYRMYSGVCNQGPDEITAVKYAIKERYSSNRQRHL